MENREAPDGAPTLPRFEGRQFPISGPVSLSNAAPPFVSIIVVTFNGRRFLDDCLSSLEAQTYPRDRREIILVDNASTDGSTDYVRQRFPHVRVLTPPRNLGFAGGNNLGIRHSRGESLALLNNDAVAHPQWLEKLVEPMRADPGLGGAASKILFLRDPTRINSAGLSLYTDGRGGDRGYDCTDVGQFDEPAEVFGACGAAVLLRRAMLDDVGLFDDRFFMYYEDLDLAWRARLRGWRFSYVPDAVVRHVHCGSSDEGSPFFLYYVERNRVFASLKNAPMRLALHSLMVFAAKTGLKWARLLSLRDRTLRDCRRALAYLRAGASICRHLPRMLQKRFRIRRQRRLTDGALAPLVSLPPPRQTETARAA